MSKVVNILLVEDDQLDVIDLRRTLDKMKILYRLKVAVNGEDAFTKLDETESEFFVGQPDVLLLDLNMPRMNGIEFLDALRKNEKWKDIRVFILTTSAEQEDKDAVKKLGVSGYIIKPFKINNTGSMDAFNLMIDLMNM